MCKNGLIVGVRLWRIPELLQVNAENIKLATPQLVHLLHILLF
jgi:hypothetical protein